jgi:hypothetical protein
MSPDQDFDYRVFNNDHSNQTLAASMSETRQQHKITSVNRDANRAGN